MIRPRLSHTVGAILAGVYLLAAAAAYMMGRANPQAMGFEWVYFMTMSLPWSTLLPIGPWGGVVLNTALRYFTGIGFVQGLAK